MSFNQFEFPKGFWQNFYQKKAGLQKHSYLKYALIFNLKGDKIDHKKKKKLTDPNNNKNIPHLRILRINAFGQKYQTFSFFEFVENT